MRRPQIPGQVSPASLLASEKITTGEQKKLGELISLQCCHFCIAGAARKPSRRGATLLRQNLSPLLSIDGEQTLNLDGQTLSTKGWNSTPLVID
jgi:hypothetical protein